ncbi:hypothetical protein, partial [Staphylococcus sp. GDX8P54P]|uniref:hypothetical protein n=1 Tax=Staphylococcus sp. GDX8P54P TaxID=2804099 RepID=UPI001AEC6E44
RRLNQAFLSSSHPCGRGPNKENFIKKFYKQSKLGSGPQQREFHQEILQTKQAGSRGPNTKNHESDFTSKAGWGYDEFKRILSHSHRFFFHFI